MKVNSYSAAGVASGSMQGTVSAGSTGKTSPASRKNNSKAKKKNVNYNPREIRSALLRAKRSQSSGQVLAQAKGKLVSLLKAKGTGQYNESQLTAAIVHAKRMVRCAQMKTQNLKQEEQLQKRQAKETKAEEQQQKNDIKLRVKRKEQNLKQKAKSEKTHRNQKQKRQQQELMQKRRLNRSKELEKLDEADLEYKKNMANSGDSSEGMDSAMAYLPQDGVELVLSEDGMELTEAQLEQQIEQQVEQMVAAEMAAVTAMPDVSFRMDAAAGGGEFAGGDLPAMDVMV